MGTVIVTNKSATPITGQITRTSDGALVGTFALFPCASQSITVAAENAPFNISVTSPFATTLANQSFTPGQTLLNYWIVGTSIVPIPTPNPYNPFGNNFAPTIDDPCQPCEEECGCGGGRSCECGCSEKKKKKKKCHCKKQKEGEKKKECHCKDKKEKKKVVYTVYRQRVCQVKSC